MYLLVLASTSLIIAPTPQKPKLLVVEGKEVVQGQLSEEDAEDTEEIDLQEILIEDDEDGEDDREEE